MGELAKESVVHLRQMFNFLQVEEYLFVTADEYSIVKLTEKGAAFLEAPEPIEMKMAKERRNRQLEAAKRAAGARSFQPGQPNLRRRKRRSSRHSARCAARSHPRKKCRRISYFLIRR